MTLEGQRSAPQVPQCIEPGCDRASTEGDERCELHQQRLGTRPSRPSKSSSPPRQVVLPVIVETALDASVAVPPRRAPRSRDLGFALGGWALGTLGFWVCAGLVFELQLHGPAEIVAGILWIAAGLLATYGAGWVAAKPFSRPTRILGAVLALATGLPSGLLLLSFVLFLLR